MNNKFNAISLVLISFTLWAIYVLKFNNDDLFKLICVSIIEVIFLQVINLIYLFSKEGT